MLVEDMVYRFKVGTAKMSVLHPNLRTYVLLSRQMEGYKAFLFNNGEKRAIKSMSASNRNLYAVLDDNEQCINHIYAKEILKGKKYPTPDNLIVLYNRLGVANIINEINIKGHRNYKILIESFLSIRSTIAHASSISLTIIDIKRWIADIQDVVNKLDRVLYSHCCKNSGVAFWPS